jgi:hypothetical protein
MGKRIGYGMTFCCGLNTKHGSVDYLLKYVSYFYWCFCSGNLSIYCDGLPTEYTLTLRHLIFQITIRIANYLLSTLYEGTYLLSNLLKLNRPQESF